MRIGYLYAPNIGGIPKFGNPPPGRRLNSYGWLIWISHGFFLFGGFATGRIELNPLLLFAHECFQLCERPPCWIIVGNSGRRWSPMAGVGLLPGRELAHSKSRGEVPCSTISRMIMNPLSCAMAAQATQNKALAGTNPGLPTTRDIVLGNFLQVADAEWDYFRIAEPST
jgi:hypothetical protein